MAKGKNNDLMPTLAGIFCFFVVFLQCLDMFDGKKWSLWGLLMPSLWLVLGLCLMTKQRNWLALVGMLPLTILRVKSIWAPLPMNAVNLFLTDLLCDVLPVAGFAVVFVFLLLSCMKTGNKFRREMWFLPLLLLLPGCIWQHGSTMVWAQFAVVACMAYWLKPAGK